MHGCNRFVSTGARIPGDLRASAFPIDILLHSVLQSLLFSVPIVATLLFPVSRRIGSARLEGVWVSCMSTSISPLHAVQFSVSCCHDPRVTSPSTSASETSTANAAHNIRRHRTRLLTAAPMSTDKGKAGRRLLRLRRCSGGYRTRWSFCLFHQPRNTPSLFLHLSLFHTLSHMTSHNHTQTQA